MKKINVLLLALACATTSLMIHQTVFAVDDDSSSPTTSSPNFCAVADVQDEHSTSLDGTVFGRGCCSYHHGQCGCTNGRVICCDGETSPTCRC